MRKIYFITDGKHIGDDNNARGVSTALSKSLNVSSKNIEEINSTQIETLLSTNKIDDHSICIAAGEHHLQSLAQIKNRLKSAMTVWSAHQYTALFEKYHTMIDVAGLPHHALKEVENPNRFTALPGVPHNLQKEKLRTAFNAYKTRIPKSKNGFILVMLGGDAPNADGKTQFYTADEAYKFAQYIAQNTRQKHLLITNGPRTGKHDPKTGAALLTHRDFHPETEEEINTPVDAVSCAFLRGLQESGLSADNDYSFYDFRFKKKGVDSAYLALLNAASKPDSLIYMAGESVSMISEVCDFGAKGKVYVYDNKAMNKDHHKAVQDLYDLGYFHRLDEKFYQKRQKKTEKGVPLVSAAQKMANAVKMKLFANPARDLKPH